MPNLSHKQGQNRAWANLKEPITGKEILMPFFAPSEPQNVPADALLGFLDAAEAAGLELHSLMILQRGSVLAKGWWEPYAPPLPHMLYSLSKSFAATAAGFAIAEKRFTLDDAVISFFPNELPDFCSDNLKAMRVRDLLSMATGHTEEPVLWATPPDRTWAGQFLAAPVAKTPGTHFLYNSPATYMVSALVEKTTGEGLLGYLTPRLFAPLGIEGATWETSPQNIAAGGWGLSLPTEAIAKFGQLYLHGIWNGVRLLPEGWVETATEKHISNGDNPNNDWNQGYGFQFWRCRHKAYRGDGAFGQFCIVYAGAGGRCRNHQQCRRRDGQRVEFDLGAVASGPAARCAVRGKTPPHLTQNSPSG